MQKKHPPQAPYKSPQPLTKWKKIIVPTMVVSMAIFIVIAFNYPKGNYNTCPDYLDNVRMEIIGKIRYSSTSHGIAGYSIRTKQGRLIELGVRYTLIPHYQELEYGDIVIKPVNSIHGTVIKKESGDTLHNVQLLNYFTACLSSDTSLHIKPPKENQL